jgi:hypothetical protein
MKISGIQRCSNGHGRSKPMSQTILCTQMLCLQASKQAFVLVCVYLEVNSFNLQNYGKIITCENFKGRRTLFDVSPIKTLFH